MTKKYFLILFSIFFSFIIVSAQSSLIDLEGVFNNKYLLDDLKNLSWRPQTTEYSYIKDETIVLVNPEQNKEEEFLTIPQLNEIFKNYELKKMPYYEWVSRDELWFPTIKKIVFLENNEWKSERISLHNIIDFAIPQRLFITKDDKGIVYVHQGENDNNKILLSTDTGKNIVFGESVHRNEWGINEGQYISPNGNYIAFYRMDESMVEDYPLVKINTPIATLENVKYPMAGKRSHTVNVGIFDVSLSFEKNNPIYHYVETNLADGEFLTNVIFSLDEQSLFITHLNRGQDHAKLIEYDVKTGAKKRVLIEETDSCYVEPRTRMIFLENGNFIWQSDRDGWKHLYLYDSIGKLHKQITSGNWDVIKVLGLDEKEEHIFFTTNKDMPTDRYVYVVNIKNGKIRNLTPEAGTHSLLFSDNFEYFIDYFQNLTTPRKIELQSVNGELRRLLVESKNPYEECNLGTTSIFKIKNKNSDDLYCRMILPPQFDSTQKYPCLIYVYGGPHSQMVTNSFMSGGVFLHYLSQQGYVIFTLDNRGTAHRGVEFEKCIHRQLGVLEVEDQMCGVEYLKNLPFIDSTRLGLDGWSYGGFMILSLITQYPDVFKAASCGGPVVDWRKYEVMYGERYMDTPAENPIGYANADIIPKVKNIRSNLLVIHGAQDNTVVWQHSLTLLQQAVKDGILIDYFVYPNHEHNVRGKERVHLWRTLEKFHQFHLK